MCKLQFIDHNFYRIHWNGCTFHANTSCTVCTGSSHILVRSYQNNIRYMRVWYITLTLQIIKKLQLRYVIQMKIMNNARKTFSVISWTLIPCIYYFLKRFIFKEIYIRNTIYHYHYMVYNK